MMEFNINNVSTLGTFIWTMIIAPLLIAVGVEIDQTVGVGIVTAILTAIVLVINARNPNELGIFGNKPSDPVTDDMVLNDEYVTGDDIDQ